MNVPVPKNLIAHKFPKFVGYMIKEKNIGGGVKEKNIGGGVFVLKSLLVGSRFNSGVTFP